MAASRNIVTALPSGLTLHADAEAEDVEIRKEIDLAPLYDQANANVIAIDPGKHQRNEIRITGDGPHAFGDVAVGDIADPSVYEEVNVEVSESNDATQRVTFSLTARSAEAFTDPAASPVAAGAEPGIDDLVITSVEYAVVEGVRRAYEVDYDLLLDSSGEPYKAVRESLVNPFTIDGRGDLPAGVGLGTGGVAFSGSDSGVTMVSSLVTGERRKDWNRWSASGGNYPAAS